MAKSIRPVLKTIDRVAVKEFLAAEAPAVSSEIDWSADDAVFGGAVETAIDAAGPAVRETVRGMLLQIDRLRNDAGRLALRSVVAEDPDLLAIFDAHDDVGAKAIALYLRDPSIFDHALSAFEFDAKLEGQSWGAYGYEAGPIAAEDPAAVQALQDSLTEMLQAQRGSQRVGVDIFRRRIRQWSDGSERSVIQVTAYVEEGPAARLRMNDDRKVSRWIDQDITENSALIDPAAGEIDVAIKGGRVMQEAFAKAIIGRLVSPDVTPVRIDKRYFDLRVLKSRRRFEIRPEDPITDARIVYMVLAAPDPDGGLLMLKRINGENRSDVYEASEKWFGDFDKVPDPSWRIVAATFRFYLPEGPNRRGRGRTSISFTLSAPNKGDVHKLPDEERSLAVGLLERWGIFPRKAGDDVIDR